MGILRAMNFLRKFADLRSFYGLSLFFAFIGSCFILISSMIPIDSLENFNKTYHILPFFLSGETYLNVIWSLGIEFNGGAILAFAFGLVSEKENLAKQIQQDKFQSQLFSELEQLDKKLDELSSLVESETGEKVLPKIKRNRWLWSILFG